MLWWYIKYYHTNLQLIQLPPDEPDFPVLYIIVVNIQRDAFCSLNISSEMQLTIIPLTD